MIECALKTTRAVGGETAVECSVDVGEPPGFAGELGAPWLANADDALERELTRSTMRIKRDGSSASECYRRRDDECRANTGCQGGNDSSRIGEGGGSGRRLELLCVRFARRAWERRRMSTES